MENKNETHWICPNCKIKLFKVIYNGIDVLECSKCSYNVPERMSKIIGLIKD